MSKKTWTKKELSTFVKWDKMRKNGSLGVPLRFLSATELMKWLKNKN